MSIATLGGIHLDAHQPITWTSRPGVLADRATWLLDAGTADAIFARRGEPMDLVYDVGDGPVTVRGLYVLALEPGDNPYTKRIRVADRRWKWARRWVSRDFNLRRKTGDQRILNNTMELATAFFDDTIGYAPWSLKDEVTPWTALDVIDAILGDELEEVAYTVTVKRPIELRVEELPIDSDGATALARALEFTPGLDIKLNEDDGLPALYDVADGSHVEVIDECGPPNVGSGFPGVSDRRAERPRSVRVLFTPEVEVRVTADHADPITHAPVTLFDGIGFGVSFRLVPVIAISDPSFVTTEYGTLNAGSWMPLHEWLEDVNSAANGGLLANGRHNNILLSEDRLLKHLITPSHPLERLDVLYAVDKFGNRDATWSNRMGQLKGAYRQIYQIHRSLLDRVRSWTLTRVAVMDEANQTRGSTQVWTDWVKRPSWAGIEERGMGLLAFPWRVEGYADRLEDAIGAPASVTVMERDTGTLRVVPKVSEWENAEMVFFGRFEADEMPAYSAAISYKWHQQKLAQAHKMSLIITAIPAAPSKRERLHAEEVTPREVSALVGYDVGQGEGPPIDIRIGPGLQTARYAWLDDADSEWASWWAGKGGPINDKPGLINGEILKGIARAAAAQVYDTYMDVPDNAHSVGLTSKARISGAITSVRHSLARDGSASTMIRTSAQVLERNPWQRMPDSLRRILERMVITP
jgi:hypothetical protein